MSTLNLQDPVLNAPYDRHPNALTVDYINTVVPFGPLIEIRTAYAQQNIPVFIRMQDKDSDWTWNNGLPTLVTTVTIPNNLLIIKCDLNSPSVIANEYGWLSLCSTRYDWWQWLWR